MDLEKRVKKLEILVKRHEYRLMHLLTAMLSMHLALKHRDKKEAQIPFILSLIVLGVDDIVDLARVIKDMKKDK